MEVLCQDGEQKDSEVYLRKPEDKWYQSKMITWISLHCCLNQKEICVSPDLDGIPAFNDLIFQKGKQTFMLQFIDDPNALDPTFSKFSENISKIREICLTQTRILNDFHEIYFVLWSNDNFLPTKHAKKLEGVHILTFLDTSHDNNVYKVDLKSATNLNCYNFYILANQSKNYDSKIMEELEQIAQELNIKSLDLKNIAEDFVQFVVDTGAEGLGKHDILNKLCELLLSKFVFKLEGMKLCGGGDDNKEIKVWDEIMRNRGVTVVDFEEDVLGFLMRWLGSKLYGFCELEGNLLGVYKRLWKNKKIPLLLVVKHVGQYEDTMRILKFTDHIVGVLIINKTGDSLNEAENWDGIAKILPRTQKLPGGSEILGDLYFNAIFRTIKFKGIIKILMGKLKIDLPKPDLINRTVSKILLKLDALEKIPEETFIIEGDLLINLDALTIKHFELNMLCNLKLEDIHEYSVIRVSSTPTENDFKKLKRQNKIIHRVACHDSNHLEWIASYGSIKKIKPFSIETEDVSKNLNPLSIISAPYGGGKSNFLDYMGLNVRHKWVLKIDLSEHEGYYRSIDCDDFLTKASLHFDYFKNYILEENNSELNQTVFKDMSGYDIIERLIFAFHGFHEVSPIYRENVLNIIKSLREEGYGVWVSTRPQLKSFLEEKLDTFVISLKDLPPGGIPLLPKSLDNLLAEHHSRFALIRLFPLDEEFLGNLKKGLEAYYEGQTDQIEALHNFGVLRLKKLVGGGLNIRFLHHNVAEYLAAHWLRKNYAESKVVKEILTRYRFSNEYQTLFKLFDELLLTQSPLHLALVNNNFGEALTIMKSDREEITKLDPCGRTIVHIIGLYSGHELNPEIFDEIPNMILGPDCFGLTPLDCALGNKNLGIAEKICKKWGLQNTSVVLEMSLKHQLLHHCAIYDYKSLMGIFLEYFSFNDVLQCKTKYPCDLKQSDYLKMIENHEYYLESITKGINYKIHTQSKYDVLNWTKSPYYDLRHAIVFDSKIEIDRLMLMRSEITRVDGFGLTPLHYAILCKNIEAFKSLLGKNVSVTHQDAFGNSPLHLAVGCSENWNICERKPLIRACAKNPNCEGIHLEMVRQLVLHSSNINLRNNTGDSPLHIAFYAKNFKVVELLLSNNADVNKINEKGKTVLHLAAQNANYEVLKTILLHEVDLNIQDDEGETPLFYAIRNNSEMAELLLCNGANPNITNRIGKYPNDIAFEQGLLKLSEFLYNLKYKNENLTGLITLAVEDAEKNPLFRAIRENNAETVEILLAQGGDVNFLNEKGQTALHLAAKSSSYTILREIIKKSNDLNSQDFAGRSPLYYAVENNRSSRTWLIYKGADVNLIDKNNQTLLHLAAKNNHNRELKELLRESTKNINARDFQGCTPLCYAVSSGNDLSAHVLVTYGADVNLSDQNHPPLLHLAAKNHKLLQELLHKKSMDIDIQDSEGNTALFCAILENNTVQRELLVNRGANVQLANKKGETIFHLAARTDDTFVLNEFLTYGTFQVDLRTENGWTSLFYAVFFNNIRTVKLLISYGADRHIKDKNGDTVFHIARKKGFQEIFEELIKHKLNGKCKECNVILESDLFKNKS